MRPTGPTAATDRRRIAAVLLGNALLYLANRASLALIGFYVFGVVQQHGGTVAASTALVATLGVVSGAVELVGAVPLGALADRVSVRPLLVGGALLGAIATQLFGLTGLIPVFYLSRALEGVSSAAAGPATLAYLTDVTGADPTRRGRVMSFYELSLLAGLALGFLFGGTLWVTVGAGGFTALAVLYGLAAAAFYGGGRAVSSRSAPRGSAGAGLRRALADPSLRRLAPAWLAINAVVGLWLTLAGPLLASPQPVPGQFLVGRFSPPEVGLIILGYVIVFAIGATIWGFLLTYIARPRALRITLGAMLLVCLGLYALNSSADWAPVARWAVVAATALAILVESGFTPAALTYLAEAVGGSAGRGAAMGIYTSLLGLGGFLGVAVAGLFSALAFNGLVASTVILAVVGLGAVALLPDRPT